LAPNCSVDPAAYAHDPDAAMRAMGWSPSVRLFEAAACGTAVISDDWRGLSDLLPDDEAILIAWGPDDVVAALTRTPEAPPGPRGPGAGPRRPTGRARSRGLADALGA